MYVALLTEVLENLLDELDLKSQYDIKDYLAKNIESKKYDLQDQALIEAIINDSERQFLNSLLENYSEMIKSFKDKNGSVAETDPDILRVEIVAIFIKNLEYYIDYFYTSLLNKHFTSS